MNDTERYADTFSVAAMHHLIELSKDRPPIRITNITTAGISVDAEPEKNDKVQMRDPFFDHESYNS